MSNTRTNEELEADFQKTKIYHEQLNRYRCSQAYNAEIDSCSNISFFQSLKFFGDKELAKKECNQTLYTRWMECSQKITYDEVYLPKKNK